MSLPGKLIRGNGKADWKNGKARNGGGRLLKSDAIDRKNSPSVCEGEFCVSALFNRSCRIHCCRRSSITAE